MKNTVSDSQSKNSEAADGKNDVVRTDSSTDDHGAQPGLTISNLWLSMLQVW